MVALATNDPDQPNVAIPLTAEAVGYALDPGSPWMDPDAPGSPRSTDDPGLGTGGGLEGGCSVSGAATAPSAHGAPALLAFAGIPALLFMARRVRRRHRSL